MAAIPLESLHASVRLICADVNGVFALEKPAGIICHPNRRGVATNSLLLLEYDPLLQAYVGSSGQFFHLLNRIDAPTSGIVILSTHAVAARAVRESFRQRWVRKTYFSYNGGGHCKSTEIWNDFLTRGTQNQKNLRVRQQMGPDARLAVTEVSNMAQFLVDGMPLSLLKLNPRTGITHQLRTQCARRNLPILNDKTYGDFRLNRIFQRKTGIKNMLLQAASIEIPYRMDGQNFTFRATSPTLDDFLNLLPGGTTLAADKLI